MRTHHPVRLSSLFAALLAATPVCQQPIEGIGTEVVALPAGAGSVTVLANGDIVYCDGTDLWRQPTGQPRQSLLHLPAFVFGSFTLDAGGGNLLFGENSTHTLWLVPLAGPAPSAPLTTVVFNYDAALLDPLRAVVSAKTGGFGTPDNQLVVVDLTTGATQTLASLPGASGAVAVASNGDVYYATASLAFPTPAGQTDVVRLRRPIVDTALQQGIVLGITDTEPVFAGLDAAADLCFDDDGDLLFTDWFTNTLGELNDAAGPAPWRSAALVDYGIAPGAAAVQFLPGPGAGTFEPFQPAGGTVAVFETDFFSVSTVRLLTARRAGLAPVGAAPIPTGTVTLQVVDGPVNGLGLLAIALDATPGSTPFAVPGFEQLLHWNTVLVNTPLLQPALFDAGGSLAVTFWNPGFATPTAATAQVALLSPNGALGSSSSGVLVFGQ